MEIIQKMQINMPCSNLIVRTISGIVMLVLLGFITYAGAFYVKLLTTVILVLLVFEIIRIPLNAKISFIEFFFLKSAFLIYSFCSLYFFLEIYKTYDYAYIIFLVSLVCLNDAGAYYIGSFLKGPKPFKNISPQKTLSGYIGGILCALTVLKAASLYYNPPFNITLISLFILSLSAHSGDLLESAFKRRMAIKDTGNIIPGHGGILDRVDSILFVNCIFYFLYK